ncbi:diacylglycerol kinase family lipid kinase [Putridiphycobacter roseus]|uniref:Diacylglycerol kinase family lipid kinase n=1 Tax=Putridiphycobacter roseus TaxID=2219161 RepID=A0A2W1NQ10_9FLAO|nr:YegS/Rv2252/BmrU family lipid kinase [Putridiphycobacter roseus]PZE17712.1 diacylglycerol kinase family lipid kinase [Putridiphycobacter roseus]
MHSKINILFIINPISGVGKKNLIPKAIAAHLSKEKFDYKIEYTQYPSHGQKIALENKHLYQAIVAIGGDGTVSEIGASLIHSECALGIIPCGSGNGIARHLAIPRKIKKAIEKINAFNVTSIDTGTCNQTPFIGLCGFGFDAHIAEAFEKHTKRGFSTYIKLVSKAYSKYKPHHYQISINDQEVKHNPLLVCIANSSQYGNGFTISPISTMQDGKFELIFIARFPLHAIPKLIKQFFSKQIHHSKYFQSITFETQVKVNITDEKTPSFHIDGDHKQSNTSSFDIQLLPKSLQVLV